MKKLINGVLFLALVGTTLFTSCSKTEEHINNVNNNALVQKSTLAGTRHLHLDGENTNCRAAGNTCLCGDDEIVITPDYNIFMDVFSEIYEGDTHSISRSFKVNFDVLTRYVKPFYIQGVIDGKMTVSAHENKTNNLKFFFFKEVSSGKEMAYQLNFIK